MKKIIFLVIFLVFVFSILVYNFKVSTPAQKEAKDVAFVIESGAGAKTIGANLLEAGLIKSKFFFNFYLWKNDLGANLKAGEYVLSPSLSIREIVRV
ncbi:MAG: endolytic transglycosylase MltG, partial [Candidatus Magasanikbacteria bacterium]|nr:endolytic transglycosylase MltG [Candidatus Magasanikbacteria bacterium]